MSFFPEVSAGHLSLGPGFWAWVQRHGIKKPVPAVIGLPVYCGDREQMDPQTPVDGDQCRGVV